MLLIAMILVQPKKTESQHVITPSFD